MQVCVKFSLHFGLQALQQAGLHVLALKHTPSMQAAAADVQHKSSDELKGQLLSAIKANEGPLRCACCYIPKTLLSESC